MTEIIVADIGGTHARLAIANIAEDNCITLSEPVKLATADHPSLQVAWEVFGQKIGRPLPTAAAIALAAPIRGELIKLTNNPWIVRPALIPEKLGVERFTLLNDFAAVAHAVGAVDEQFLAPIAGPDAPLPHDGVISVIGPGTGLGVAAIVRQGGHSHILATEGGHSDFAPLDAIEDRILASLRAKFTRVSVERVVAGSGLRAIYEVLAEMEGREMPKGDDKALWTFALEGHDSIAAAALDRFLMALGSVAGDIALTHGPGPVVLAGGLGLRLARHLPQSGFAERFVSKGRYRGLMESLPVKIITYPEPGLYGAAAAFAQEHLQSN
ncbi:MAG: glucokinase [Parasphingorhabdus sp.]|nr:glucokinase [Parasphingorhabdus sp.]